MSVVLTSGFQSALSKWSASEPNLYGLMFKLLWFFFLQVPDIRLPAKARFHCRREVNVVSVELVLDFQIESVSFVVSAIKVFVSGTQN